MHKNVGTTSRLDIHKTSYDRLKSKVTITNLDLVIDITSTLHSLLSLIIKAHALLFIRLYLSKASQASLLGLNYFCILLYSSNQPVMFVFFVNNSSVINLI
jgi:hypothetical protein